MLYWAHIVQLFRFLSTSNIHVPLTLATESLYASLERFLDFAEEHVSDLADDVCRVHTAEVSRVKLLVAKLRALFPLDYVFVFVAGCLAGPLIDAVSLCRRVISRRFRRLETRANLPLRPLL